MQIEHIQICSLTPGYDQPYRNKHTQICTGDLKITSTGTERQKHSQNSAPVLVIISGNSLAFSRKIITSTGFYRCCAAGASALVVVKKQSPINLYPLAEDNRHLTYSNGAMQVRLGLELAEYLSDN